MAAADLGTTANVYSDGWSETIIGKTVEKYNIPRHELVILTKCGGYVAKSLQVSQAYISRQVRKQFDSPPSVAVLGSLNV